MNRAAAVATASCALALLATACGSTSASPTPSSTASLAPSSDSSSSDSSQCTSAQLTATTGGSAMEGVAVLAIVFTNNSPATCQVSGYPGVAGLDAAGTQTAQATRQPGLAAATITLPPGSSASALVRTAAVNSAPNCEFAGGLAVTPPNTSTTVTLSDPADKLNSCALTVTPVVPGKDGGDSNIQ